MLLYLLYQDPSHFIAVMTLLSRKDLFRIEFGERES